MVATPPLDRLQQEIDQNSDLWKILFDPSPEWTQKWIETFLTIDNERGQIVPFKLYPQQIQMLHDHTGRDITIKGRQTRASSLILARNLRRFTSQFGLKWVTATQDDQTTATFRARIQHHIRDLANNGFELPVEMDNEQEMVLGGGFENRIMFLSGNQAVLGRGVSGHIVHISELAHWPPERAAGLIGDITPSVPGAPYGWFDIESTPKGADNILHDKVMDSKIYDPESLWSTFLYPWWNEPRYRVGPDMLADVILTQEEVDRRCKEFRPSPEEERLIGLNGLKIEQILWRRIKTKELLKTGTPFLQELVESLDTCFVAASENFFASPDGIDHLGYYRLGIMDPLFRKEELPYAGGEVSFFGPNLDIWEPPQTGTRYCGWMDCAGGGLDDKSDYTSLAIMDADSKRHVATLRLKAAPDESAPMAAAVMTYYNTGLLGGERDAFGSAAVRKLEEIGYPNLWYYYDAWHKAEGQAWAHPTQVREKILGTLRKAVFAHVISTKDRTLVQEMGSFGWAKYQERRKAMGQRSHDDMVLAIAGAMYIANEYGRNLGQITPDDQEDVVVGPFGLIVSRTPAKKGNTRLESWMR